MYTITIWPVIVAAIASFAIGALWYSPMIFGKEWMALIKMSDDDIAEAKAKGMWKSYLMQFIASLVTFAVLAFMIAATNIVRAADGAFLGFILWLGFIAPNGVSGLLWKKEPLKLVLIDTIGILIGLIVGGAILGGWR